MFLHLKLNPTNCSDAIVHSNPECRAWNISYDQNFSAYQVSVSNKFNQWNAANFNDADSLWNSWKSTLISIALDTIGCKETKKTGKQWWDKSIDEAIQETKRACKEHRRWSKEDRQDKERGDVLWEDYKLKKLHTKKLIQQKIDKMRFERSIKIAQAGGSSCRDFWKELRGKKKEEECNSLKLPNSNEITTDKSVIKSSVMNYWNTLGKMNRELNWINCIEKSLINCGYDHVFCFVYNHNYNQHWVNLLKHANCNHCDINWYETACNKSSLSNYLSFKKQPYLECYLLDKEDFYGVNLKFKTRSNTLHLNSRISSWVGSHTFGLCNICNDNAAEDILKHFMLSSGV